MAWTVRTWPGGTNVSQVCVAGNKIYYGNAFRVAAGGGTANNPNGDVYEYDTDTLTGSLIYDASTFTSSPEVHRGSYGLASFGGVLYGIFTYYNSTGPNYDIKIQSWNGSVWSTVHTVSSAGTGGLTYGFIGANDSRIYAMAYTSSGASLTEGAVMYYSDDGSSWSAGSVSGDPLAQSPLSTNTYYKPAYFPAGIYANFWQGDGAGIATDKKIFLFSGTSVAVAADNTAGSKYYRSSGIDGYHWANQGDPPEVFASGLGSVSEPSNNSSVDEQILTIGNLHYSFAVFRDGTGPTDGTSLYRYNGSTWVFFDTVQYGGIGPQFQGQTTWLILLNGKYWIFGPNNEAASAYNIFSEEAPSTYGFGVTHSAAGIPGSII